MFREGGASPVPPSQNSGDIKYEMIVKYDRCVCFKVNFSRAKVVGLEFQTCPKGSNSLRPAGHTALALSRDGITPLSVLRARVDMRVAVHTCRCLRGAGTGGRRRKPGLASLGFFRIARPCRVAFPGKEPQGEALLVELFLKMRVLSAS